MIVFSSESLRVENDKQIPDVSGRHFVWNFPDFDKGCPKLMNENYSILSRLLDTLNERARK